MKGKTEKDEMLKKIYQYLISEDGELVTLGLAMYGEFCPSHYKDIYESVKHVENTAGQTAKAQIRVYLKRKEHEKSISKTKL